MIKLNNQELIKPTIFPDKTSQVWKVNTESLNDYVNSITWEFENEAEFLHVAQLSDLVRSLKPNANLTLFVPYFPYARQDKEVSNNSTFALRTFCKLLDSLDFNNIVTNDLHSDVAKHYLKLIDLKPIHEIEMAMLKTKSTVIIFPDKGAKQRYSYLDFKSLNVEKERDQQTGALMIKGIEGDTRCIENANLLIVDDLCDRGGTFILTAKLLHEFKPNSISLYTTHGIYSKGIDIIKDAGIQRVFNLKGEV